VTFYQKNGFIKLKQVLSPAVLAHYGREISAKVKELQFDIPTEKRTTYHSIPVGHSTVPGQTPPIVRAR
jgi:hypothetical protein